RPEQRLREFRHPQRLIFESYARPTSELYGALERPNRLSELPDNQVSAPQAAERLDARERRADALGDLRRLGRVSKYVLGLACVAREPDVNHVRPPLDLEITLLHGDAERVLQSLCRFLESSHEAENRALDHQTECVRAGHAEPGPERWVIGAQGDPLI